MVAQHFNAAVKFSQNGKFSVQVLYAYFLNKIYCQDFASKKIEIVSQYLMKTLQDKKAHRAVCHFTSQLSMVLIAPIHV